MRVKCIINDDYPEWATLGKVYDVLEVDEWDYLIVDDVGDEFWVSHYNFEVIEEDTIVAEEKQEWVNNPKHYNKHPSGVECIDIIEHMSFNLGNAVKYIWRCDLKRDAIEDLRKAEFYIKREIEKREKEQQ